MTATAPVLFTIATVIEILLLRISFLRRLDTHIVETIIIYVLTSLVYLFSVFFVLRISRKANPFSRKQLMLLIGVPALIFRLTVWPVFPSLSDDVFRYRWEGKLQAQGGNPYQVRPNDPQWAHLRDETFPFVGNKDFKAGYGPLLELFELGAYRVLTRFTPDGYRQAFWFKAPFAVFDLAAILTLWALLKARGLPPERLLIYAWSPLPVMEFWAAGHNDSVVVFFLLAALLLAARERWTLSFAGLSLAAAAKIWPLLLFPIFIGWKSWRPQRWRQWSVLLPIAGLLALPYWSDVTENVRFMSGFLGGWRNNDSLFGLLLWLTGDIYRAKYLAFAIVISMSLFAAFRGWPLEKAVLTAVVAMLMFSANCHPWYLAWFLPLLAFLPVPALLLWTALMPLAYHVVIRWVELHEWRGSTGMRWLIYVPVYGLLVGRWLLKRRWRRT